MKILKKMFVFLMSVAIIYSFFIKPEIDSFLQNNNAKVDFGIRNKDGSIGPYVDLQFGPKYRSEINSFDVSKKEDSHEAVADKRVWPIILAFLALIFLIIIIMGKRWREESTEPEPSFLIGEEDEEIRITFSELIRSPQSYVDKEVIVAKGRALYVFRTDGKAIVLAVPADLSAPSVQTSLFIPVIFEAEDEVDAGDVIAEVTGEICEETVNGQKVFYLEPSEYDFDKAVPESFRQTLKNVCRAAYIEFQE